MYFAMISVLQCIKSISISSEVILPKLSPASLTKIMTAILLLDKHNLEDSIVVQYPKNYKNIGKVAYIKDNK